MQAQLVYSRCGCFVAVAVLATETSLQRAAACCMRSWAMRAVEAGASTGTAPWGPALDGGGGGATKGAASTRKVSGVYAKGGV